MEIDNKLFVVGVIMLIVGLIFGYAIGHQAGYEKGYVEFVEKLDRLEEIPLMQGFFLGYVSMLDTMHKWQPDLNYMEYIQFAFDDSVSDFPDIMLGVERIYGHESINCWLIDIGEQNSNREDYDCERYDKQLEELRAND